MTEKTGLVLEGGGMRGIYTAGVLDTFMEHDITFDGVIGVSAGAIHGASYVAGQKGRDYRYFSKYCQDKHFMSFYSFFTTGDVVGYQLCYHDIPEILDPFDFEAFKAAQTEFYATCTNIETGKAEYIKITDVRKQMDYIRASASLPYVSKIVSVGGKKYLDGGMSDSIPAVAMKKLGFTKRVVVLTRDITYRKTKDKLDVLAKMYRHYPNLINTIKSRYIRYNAEVLQIEKEEKKGGLFVIRPSLPLHIGRMESNREVIKQVYELGRADGEKQLQKMISFLGKH